MQLHLARAVGPLDDPVGFVRPQGYTDFLKDLTLETGESKRASAERILKRFESRAFRRPVLTAAMRLMIDSPESVGSETEVRPVGDSTGCLTDV